MAHLILINAGFVLSRFLKIKERCYFHDLSKIKEKIQKCFPEVYVKVDKDSVLSYVNVYPQIFKYNGKYIETADKSAVFFEDGVIDYFNNGLENDLKDKIIEIINRI